MKGVVIVGHGSRSIEAQQQFNKVVDMVAAKSKCKVAGSFMELAEPGFFEVVDKLVGEGINEIAVYPLFLFSGIHIREDIPQMIEDAKKKHPHVSFRFLEPIGAREELAQIVLTSIGE